MLAGLSKGGVMADLRDKAKDMKDDAEDKFNEMKGRLKEKKEQHDNPDEQM